MPKTRTEKKRLPKKVSERAIGAWIMAKKCERSQVTGPCI